VNSLIRSDLQGNLEFLGDFEQKQPRICKQKQMLVAKFPKEDNREFSNPIRDF
jgi:hypothetical protein